VENKATDAWFYSQKGERFGPVTFPELKTLAAGTELSPRNDVVWTHGMADWAPAGEIDGQLAQFGRVAFALRRASTLLGLLGGIEPAALAAVAHRASLPDEWAPLKAPLAKREETGEEDEDEEEEDDDEED
jgi:hypothetical protein